MTEQRAIWKIQPRDLAAEETLMKELGVPSIVAAVLVRRGLGDPAAAHKFLNPSLDDLHDPRLLPDYEKAVGLIMGAKERGELIYVHGDYDVDGVSSTALMTRFLQKIGCQVVPHVPHRMKEGYGIHLDAVQWAKEQGTSLFLTCDCGITAFEQLAAARSAGMKTLVTDHHEPKALLPKADAVVNPHRKDSEYPFSDLSGVGVVFKLAQGISEQLGFKDQFIRAYLDLAVLGTVADVMPLVDENRVITKFGLERVTETKKAGLRALMDVSGMGPGWRVTARDIGFKLGPRINAVGRLDDADVALRLFLTDDAAVARTHAEYLDKKNIARREEQDAMILSASAMVADRKLNERMVMVLADQGWHPGIIGIVAGKLTEQFRRPTFVIALGEDGKGKGSGRSIPGFSLAEAIEHFSDVLLGGGGHEMAAGLTIEADRVDEFAEKIHEYAAGFMSPEDFVPVLEVDAEVSLEEAGTVAAEALELLQPFGEANPEPMFTTPKAQLVSLKRTSKPEHAIVNFSAGGQMMRGVGWRLADQLEPMLGLDCRVAYRLEVNEFNGRRNAQWNVQDCQSDELEMAREAARDEAELV